MTTTHLDNIAIGEIRTNAKGGKCANITQKNEPIVNVSTTPLTCPFGAGIYQGGAKPG